jgi:hypothetical protein
MGTSSVVLALWFGAICSLDHALMSMCWAHYTAPAHRRRILGLAALEVHGLRGSGLLCLRGGAGLGLLRLLEEVCRSSGAPGSQRCAESGHAGSGDSLHNVLRQVLALQGGNSGQMRRTAVHVNVGGGGFPLADTTRSKATTTPPLDRTISHSVVSCIFHTA